MAKRNNRTRQKVSRKFNDGLLSTLSDMAVSVNAMKYTPTKRLTKKDVDNQLQASWVSQKFINKTVEDMLKKGREFEGEVSKDQEIEINRLEKKHKVNSVLSDALTWSSQYGDCLVVAITKSTNIEQPLNLEVEDLVKFLVLQEGEYQPSNNVIDDIAHEHYLMPESYKITINKGDEMTFHYSRCHRIKLGKQPISKISEMGTSDLQSPYSAIKIFEAAVLNMGDNIKNANVDILKMNGLNDRIGECEGDKIIEYAMMFARTISSNNLGMIDSEDELIQKQANFAGLSDVIDKMFSVLAGALDRPITVLFGQSASGFSTGEEDNRRYYETINALQESRLRPLQEFIDKFILDVVGGDIDELYFSYPSIDSMNAKERGEMLGVMSAGLVALIESGVITEEAALRELRDRGALLSVTEDDIGDVKDVTAPYGNW